MPKATVSRIKPAAPEPYTETAIDTLCADLNAAYAIADLLYELVNHDNNLEQLSPHTASESLHLITTRLAHALELAKSDQLANAPRGAA